MNNILFVELLIHPDNHLLAVRPSTDKNRHAIRWSTVKEAAHQPRTISGSAFLPTIYEIYGWKIECKYRVRGIRKQNADEVVYMFEMKETEIFIPSDTMETDHAKELSDNVSFETRSSMKPLMTTPKTVCAYPVGWAETFGNDYYHHAQAQEMFTFSETGKWHTQVEGQIYNESPLQVTNSEEIQIHIAKIIEDMKQEGACADG